MMVLTCHGAEPANLPEHPLENRLTVAQIGGKKRSRLLGEIKKIAPDSNIGIGLPPSLGFRSTIAGMRLFDEIVRNSGLN